MSACSACGAAFECGMVDGAPDTPCWCTRLPALAPEAYARNTLGGSGNASCLCPDCLRALISRTRDRAADGE